MADDDNSFGAETLEALVSALAEGVLLHERSGRIVASNPAAAAILGLTRDGLYGLKSVDPRWRTIREDGSDYPGTDHPVMRTLRDGREIDGDIVGIRQPDNQLRWLSVSTRIAKSGSDGLPELVVVSFTDVTVAKTRELRLASILETVDLAVISMEADGLVRGFNRRAEQIFGWRAEEIIGRPVTELMDENDARRHAELVDTYVKTGRGRLVGSGRRVIGKGKGGESFPIYLQVSDASFGDRDFFFAAIRDLRHQDSLERQLLESQKMEAVGTLASGIAHDFNNILQGLLLAVESTATLGPEAATRLDPAIRFIDRGRELISQILQVTAHHVEADESFDALPVLEDIVAFLRATLPKSLDIRVELPNTPVWLFGTQAALHTIVVNLATNAASAMGIHGVLEIGAECSSDAVVLVVRDTGTGIAEGDMRRIFEPFFTTKPAGEGTGLGLSAVNRATERFGGKVEVESTLGQGTSFSITLPLSEAPAKTRTVEKLRDVGRLSGSVVVVDDEELVCFSLGTVLRDRGLAVETFTDAREALAYLKTNTVDVVITDQSMPELSGPALLKSLAGSEKPPVAIMMTGFLTGEAQAALESGTLILQKPFPIDELLQTLNATLPEARPK